MNCVRSEFFARATLSLDKNVGRRRCDLFNGLEHFVQRCGVAPDVFEAIAFVHLLAERAIFLLKFASLHRARDQHFDFVEIERLRHEVVGAAFHRLDCDIDRTVRCHHDADRRTRHFQSAIN